MNINSLTASILSFLETNNTTTASIDLSANISPRIKSFKQGVKGSHLRKPISSLQYPLIYVEADRSAQVFSELGNNARRDIDVNIDIVAVTNEGPGSRDGRETADKEIMELSYNLETFIQNNITMNNLVDWVRVDGVDYSANVRDNFYNSISIISTVSRVRV